MEVITIESKAYLDLLEKIDQIIQFIVTNKTECTSSDKTNNRDYWLDSFEVANILNISTRTLQRLRSDHLINYSILRGKCYFKISDIEEALKNRLIRCNPQTLEDFHKNYLLHVKQK